MKKFSVAQTLPTICLLLSLVALYVSYTSLLNARASAKAVDAIIQGKQPQATSKSKWDIQGWNCNNTVINEPGKPERLLGQTCTMSNRIELEPPESRGVLSRLKNWVAGE